jgi:hypothetical protein
MRTKRYTEQEFIEAVKQNQSIRAVLKQLGLKPAGGNYKALQWRVKQLNLDTSHWTGQGHLKGKHNYWVPKRTLEDILVKDSTYTSSYGLKNRLLEEGWLERRCYCCGGTDWLSKPIPLELEHRNGDTFDNRIENLSLLCPNCHALTPTYRGKNKGRVTK